jgi:hypothetical protein
VLDRLNAPRARHLKPACIIASHPYIRDHLFVPAVLLDQVRPAFGVQDTHLPDVLAIFNRLRGKVLVKLDRIELKFRNRNQHRISILRLRR